jgi:hypothetical protein
LRLRLRSRLRQPAGLGHERARKRGQPLGARGRAVQSPFSRSCPAPQDSSPQPSPQRGEGERSGGEDGARLRREFPLVDCRSGAGSTDVGSR